MEALPRSLSAKRAPFRRSAGADAVIAGEPREIAACRPRHTGAGTHRLTRGEAEDLAEASFRKAIDIARRQQARSWELRAIPSLNRLLQKQGRNVEARRRLSEIYSWFTEGFDTADL